MKNYILSLLLLCIGLGAQAQSAKEIQLGFRAIPTGEEVFLGTSIAYYQGISTRFSVGIRADVTTDALGKNKMDDYSGYTFLNIDVVARFALSTKQKRFQWFVAAGLSGMRVVEEILPQHFIYCGNISVAEQRRLEYLLAHTTYEIDYLLGGSLGVAMEVRLGNHFRVGLDLPMYIYHSTKWQSSELHANPTLKGVYIF